MMCASYLRKRRDEAFFWKRIQGHAEEVNVEFPIEVMQFVVRLSVRSIRIHFFQAVLIVGTPGVDTFPNDEELPVLYRDQGTTAEGTSDLVFFTKSCFSGGKQLTTDLALVLAFGTIVPVEILGRGSTAGTVESLRDIDISPAADRLEFTAVMAALVFQAADRLEFTAVMAALVFQAEMFPVLVSGRDDLRKGGVSLELLVLWRVRVIEGPLLQRYVSADEGKKPAVLLVKSFDN